MPQSNHDRGAELHNVAEHAHDTAATGHGKSDHLTAHELSEQARELSKNVHKTAEQLVTEAEKSSKA
jgi:hypothetical protein